MKRTIFFLMIAACLCLGACQAPPPEKAADGADWSEDWLTIGDILGVDAPEKFTLRDNNDTLAANAMYYASWSIGEEASYTDDGGEENTIYDAQLFLLLAGASSVEKATETQAEWLALAEERYQIENRETRSCNGQEFTVISYRFASGPYDRGVSAFGLYGNYAISAELSCQEAFTDDILECLLDFLENCHYGA